MQTIQCPKCQAVIVVPDITTEVVQGSELSVVVCHHAHSLDCPMCNAYLTSGVAMVDVQIGWKLDKREDAPRVVLASALSPSMQ